LAKGFLALSRGVTFVVTELSSTFTVIRVSLVRKVVVLEALLEERYSLAENGRGTKSKRDRSCQLQHGDFDSKVRLCIRSKQKESGDGDATSSQRSREREK
jgi:hypothetical protein